jgi:predicted amidophosphoribosyltransferase
MKKCPFCGAELNDDNLFCTECGKELPKGIECPHCGASVNEGDIFCTECGKRLDEVPQATSSEPIKPKCPHCGAPMNEGDAFCMECGKKVDELQAEKADEVVATKECPHCGATMREDARFCPNCDKYVNNESSETASETPQTEEETQDFNYSYVEEEPKTWRDYKLPIFGGIFLILFLGACWWFYDSSNKRVAEEKAIADFIEVVRQDSIKTAEAKMEEEKEAVDKEQHIAACKAFLEKFFKGLDNSNDLQEYVKQNTTFKAQQFLKDEYDLEDDCSNCLATWMFTKESGTEIGPLQDREIQMEDENTYQVVSIYELDNAGQYTAYEYVVKIGIVKEGNFYKIDTIEKISASPIIG